MSVTKYVGEQDADHGGNLFWPGAMGFPMRGAQAPTLTQTEYEDQVEVHHDFHSEEFDLSDETQKAQYLGIMDRIVNGWYVRHYHEPPTRHPKTGKRVAYVEWSQRYGALSPSASRRTLTGGSSITKAG